MHITELVLQGIRSFVTPKKLAFKKGLNVVLGQKSTGKTTIREVLVQLLYNHPAADVLAAFQNQASPGTCRAGMSFESRERIYRKVVDFSQASFNLSRFNSTKNSYEGLTQDAMQIAQFFREELKLPREEVYRLIYTSVASEFPGFHAVSSPSMGSGSKPMGGVDTTALQHELQGLRRLRENAVKIKQLQFEQDGIQKEQFEFMDLIKKEEGFRKKLAEINGELSAIGSMPEIPDDIESRVEAYDKAAKRHEAEVPILQQDVFDLQDRLTFVEVEPLEKDSQFLGGFGSAFLAIIIASFTYSQKEIFNVPGKLFAGIGLMVAVVGIVTAVSRVLKHLSAKDEHARISKDIQMKSEKIKAIDRKFEVETSVVRNIMKAAPADTTRELFATISRVRAFRDRAKEIEAQIAQLQSRPDYKRAAQDLPKIKERVAKIDQDLQQLSSSPLEVSNLEVEIANLETQLRKAGVSVAGGGAAVSPTDDWLQGISEDFISSMGRDHFYNHTHRMVIATALSLNVKVEDFIQKLTQPLDKNLGAFSFKNFTEPKLDKDGTFSLMDREQNSRVRFEQLEHFKQDLVYFSLKFTLLQFLLRDIPLPVVFDSAFQKFDHRMNPVIAKAVKFLSQQGQVLFLTDQEVYTQGADLVVNI